MRRLQKEEKLTREGALAKRFMSEISWHGKLFHGRSFRNEETADRRVKKMKRHVCNRLV